MGNVFCCTCCSGSVTSQGSQDKGGDGRPADFEAEFSGKDSENSFKAKLSPSMGSWYQKGKEKTKKGGAVLPAAVTVPRVARCVYHSG